MADRYQEYVWERGVGSREWGAGRGEQGVDIVLATINAKWIHPSLALRLLKANLGSLEADCEILEFALRQPLKEKVEPILAARPRVLGLSVSIWNHLATLELLKALDTAWKDASGTNPETRQKPLVVLGGPEITWLPVVGAVPGQETPEIFQYADYVIRGEGEESFRSLCYGIFYGDPGVGSSSGAAVDLTAITPAYRLYTEEDLKKKLVYVEASRGCPYGCEFCQGPLGPGAARQVREFPLEPFLAEMDTLIERGGRQFKFLDRTFNLNIERAISIMEFFLDRLDTRLCVHFEMVPFRFPPELKDVIRRFPAGSLRLELGIQTFNPAAAELINLAAASPAAGRQAREVIETLEFLARDTNAIIHADLIAGLPGEDLASFGAGFDRLWQVLSTSSSPAEPGLYQKSSGRLQHSAFEIQLGILKCLPGTPIVRRSEAYGMKYSPAPPYEVTGTAALPSAELERIKNFARFWELTVNRNPFPDMLPRLVPPGEPVFERFMILSDKLRESFGRNWGIDRADLRLALKEWGIGSGEWGVGSLFTDYA